LAEVVAPGEVVGIDLEPEQIEKARRLGVTQGMDSVRFEVGDVYKLRYPDRSFDAAWASFMLEHLRSPLAALKEIRRVLKPGGVLGILDYDYGMRLLEPSTALLEESRRLYIRIREYNASSPQYARYQRRLLREAGFARTEGSAYAPSWGTIEATRGYADVMVKMLGEPEVTGVAIDQGWVDRATLDAIIAEWRVWGEQPDAFSAWLACAAIGWVAVEA
jgi:ubiquinone/menaquinone biosynthesis C-methylase UbiE